MKQTTEETNTYDNYGRTDYGRNLRHVTDALEVLYGKWKLRILYTIFRGHARYKDILEENPGLTDKTLSQNLRLLLDSGLIERVVSDGTNFPRNGVEYRLTAHGATIQPLMEALASWGVQHREYIINRKISSDS